MMREIAVEAEVGEGAGGAASARGEDRAHLLRPEVVGVHPPLLGGEPAEEHLLGPAGERDLVLHVRLGAPEQKRPQRLSEGPYLRASRR